MSRNRYISIIEAMGNNLYVDNQVFISPDNIYCLPFIINDCNDFEDLLITPFLVIGDPVLVYELYYLEFCIGIEDIESSYFVMNDVVDLNSVGFQMLRKQRAIIATGDFQFLKNALIEYFNIMKDLNLDSERNSNHLLLNANVYFQMY